MGLIKAVSGAIGGSLADQWLEVIQADNMTPQTLIAPGVMVRRDKRSSNTKATVDVISNGSKIFVAPNQMLILIQDGAIVDYTAEAGAYIVDNSAAPSLFNGQFKEALRDTFERFKYGGTAPYNQKAVFINLQEIAGIKFGTKTPLQYFDNFYNSELFLRCFGNYSVQVVDPLLFYEMVGNKGNNIRLEVQDLNEQYNSEFMNALSASINQMSADGIRISHVPSHSMKLADYMSDALDEAWEEERGFTILAVGIESISYTEDSQELINMRNKGAMLSDPTIRESYVQGSIARGLEDAGSNEGGAGQAYLGMGIGMQGAGNFKESSSNFNMEQLKAQERQAKEQAADEPNQSKESAPAETAKGNGSLNFCPNCGQSLKGVEANFCPNCGYKLK